MCAKNKYYIHMKTITYLLFILIVALLTRTKPSNVIDAIEKLDEYQEI